MSTSQVWLITGSASGLGRSIAEAALAAGHRVVATARDPGRLADLVQRFGDQVRTARVDVTDESAARAAVQTAVSAFGHLDVVVNNAGFGQIAPFEQVSAADFRALIETCFFGVVNMTRAALPVLRAQRSGLVIQISSVGARITTPGSAAYHAAKWAVSGFTESLAQEVAPFGVRMCAVEPGGMRTNYGVRASADMPNLLPDYEASVGAFSAAMAPYWGQETSHPSKIAAALLQLASSDNVPAHLLLGSDAVHYVAKVEAERTAEGERWRELSLSTDLDAAPAGR